MEVGVLGPLEAAHGGEPLAVGGGKQRALLAVLALNAGRTVSTEQLVDELWGDDVPETAAKMVQIYVSQLRKALPEGTIVTRAPGYSAALEPDAVDAHRFERLLAEGRRARAAGHMEEAAAVLREALALWRGPALAEFPSEPFARSEGSRLEELRLAALEERIDADLALGRHGDLVGELEALVARHPLRERLRGQQLLALYRSGRQADALAAYQDARRALDEELGIQPSPELRELERRILQQDPELAGPARPTLAAAPAAPARDAVALVGRVDEAAFLGAELGRALDGRRRLVFISGAPGLGKTTLLESFLASVPADGSVLVGRGRCLEHRGAGEPYMPVLDALARLCRGPGGDAVTRVLAVQAPTWLVQLPWLVEAEEAQALQQRVFGATRERMLREMAEALDALAAERPVVLALEDLHWSDASTLDLLAWLAHREEAARLLVVGTHRTGEVDAESPAAALERDLRMRRLCVKVALEPLDVEGVGALAALRLGGEASRGLAEVVYAQTGGNPLFVETVVDEWSEEGALASGEEGWALRPGFDPAASGVPGSLGALLGEQLDRLDPAVLLVLEAASVVGPEFSTAAVAAAAEQESEHVETVCEELARRGSFLRALGTVAWPDGTVAGQYGFTHHLHQQVLSERLPAARRARLHERVAERLEQAFATEPDAVTHELAVHYVRAHTPGRAVRFLARAAEQAAARKANPETLEHVRGALEALPAMPAGPERDRLELRLQVLQAEIQALTAGWAEPLVEEALLRARALCAHLRDNEPLVPVLLRLATVYEVRGEYARAEGVVRECLAIAPEANDAVDTQELLACSLLHQGSFARALEHAEHGIALDVPDEEQLLSQFGESSMIACHDWAALALWFLGRPDSANARVAESIRLAEQPERRHSLATAYAHAAIVQQCRGDTAEASRLARAAIAAAEERGYLLRRAMGTVVHGWARALDGDGAGIAELRHGIELARATGARMDDPHFLALLGEACLVRGRFAEGLEAVEEGLDIVRREHVSFYEAELHRLRASLRLHLGRPSEEAEDDLRAALAVAQRQGACSLELRAAIDLAALLASRGEESEARAVLERPYHRITEGQELPDLVAARQLLAGLGAEVPGAEQDGMPERAPARSTRVAYARSGDVNIAYEVTGRGPVDLVLVPGFVSHLQLDWDEPRHARFLERLGSFSRLIRFDKRGTGLSDRPGDLPDLDTRMGDVLAVMDAVGSERAVLFGYSEGGPMSILLAATHPDRTTGLALYGAYAARTRKDDYPWPPTAEERAAYALEIERDWGWESDMQRMCPSADEDLARWWGARARAAASPGDARRLIEMNSLIDVRELLPSVHVPTLVLHRTDDLDVAVEEGRYIAERIPGAQYVELAGRDHFVSVDPDQIVDEVERFVATLGPAAAPDRMLASILVSDVVGSTELATSLGDRRWSDLIGRHHTVVHEVLSEYGGELVDTAGDGVLALFDGPARAIRAGAALRDRLARLDLRVRIGVHTGEIERVGGDARGIAVHLAARVAAEAGAGEVLVTGTTRDLVAGSGLSFAERGARRLKGIDDARTLYAAEL